MFFRFAGSYFALVLITISVLIGVTGVMTNQIQFLITNIDLEFIPSEIGLEEEIVILIAAFGVFLEHRYWLLDRLYPDGIPADVKTFDQYTHEFGVFLILLAIFMEATDLGFLALNNWVLNSLV